MLIALLFVAVGLPAVADAKRGGEAGVVVGVIAPDEVMTGDSSATDAILGFRGGAVFTSHWGWFVDALYSDIGTKNGLGDASTIIGRSGMDYIFTPEKDSRWLVSFGVGWMVVDYDDASTQDFHNPLASIGFGQRIRIGDGNTHLRWELRGDHTLDDARLSDKLVQGLATVAFTWGPYGDARTPKGESHQDADRDGVRDKRDRCPDTPAGADVDPRGCPSDGDRDGVLDGVDQCPRSRAGDDVGPDGCQSDADGDGVPDITDVCANTPTGAETDDWGCPQDADADSVYDGIDQCPRTPLGAWVDDRGCPADGDGDGVFDGLDRCPRTEPGVTIDPTGCAVD
jgi:hypothetical protein